MISKNRIDFFIVFNIDPVKIRKFFETDIFSIFVLNIEFV